MPKSVLQNEIELARLCGSARMAGLFTLHGLGNSGIIKNTIKPENNEVQMEVFEIETERLQLRQFRVEDAAGLFPG